MEGYTPTETKYDECLYGTFSAWLSRLKYEFGCRLKWRISKEFQLGTQMECSCENSFSFLSNIPSHISTHRHFHKENTT